MKKIINKTNLLVALLFAFIACLIGATTLSLTAHAQEEEPTSTVEITSFTTVMEVGEEFEFAAEVTLADGTTTDVVTWSSSNEEVIYIEDGLAEAYTEGNATITATAADGASASVNVLVSNSAVRVQSIEAYPSELELGVGWSLRVNYTILPQDAYEQGATWSSSNPAVVTVDANGNVEAIAAGDANIIVTARDTLNGATATIPVTVYANFEEATISPDTYTMRIGDDYDLILTLPEGVAVAENTLPRWYSLEDSVASVDRIVDTTGTVFAWSYGTTMIYAVAHGTDGNVYGATATIHVMAEFYYLTGLYSDLDDPEGNPWVTYDTAAAAREAGVLLEQSADNPYVFSITRDFWAYDYFQIIHDNMDAEWTTRITSTSFSEEGSTMDYVANTVDTFGMTDLGTYTVTLDLSSGRAKVTIEMVSLKVTSFNLSIAEGSKSYLQYNCAETGAAEDAARTMDLDVYTIPETAVINPADVSITTNPSVSDYVRIAYKVIATSIVGQEGLPEYSIQITLTLLEAPTDEITFQLIIEIDNKFTNLPNPTDDVTITILPDGEPYVPVSAVTFTNTEEYLVNVNNGATEWISSTPIEAMVNADASVQGVVYSELSDHIYIEYREVENEAGEMELKPFVHADALGTYTIYATSLGADADGNTVTAETTVLVTSLVGTEPNYSTGFYLIGELGGRIVENWTSIPPTETTFGDSDFAHWTLPLSAQQDKIYTATYHLEALDRFSIAFLGMDGNWGGIINANYMDWANSVGNYYESDGNVQTTVAGEYIITLNLSYERPFFRVDLVEEDTSTYNLNLYIVRGGDTWNADATEQENILATVGYIQIVDGVAQSLTLTLDSYTFTADPASWPVIQFVTARGIEGGYFYGETWYGESYRDLTFDGTAYRDPDAEDLAGHFTNYNGNSVLYWVSDSVSTTTPITVSFTFTFNAAGVLTNVVVAFPTTETAE